MLWFSAPSVDLRWDGELEDGTLDWDKLIKQLPTSHSGHGQFALNDVLLSPAKVVTGLSKFAKYSTEARRARTPAEHSLAAACAACSFTLGSSSVESEEFRVGPVPIRLVHNNYQGLSSTYSPSRGLRGDWSIVVIHEQPFPRNYAPFIGNYDEKWTYAFVTPEDGQDPASDKTKFIVKDMKGFLL